MPAKKYNISFEPENEEQLEMVKAFLKSVIKLPFKISKEECPYDPEFMKMIEQTDKDMDEGKYIAFKNTDEIKKHFGLDEDI